MGWDQKVHQLREMERLTGETDTVKTPITYPLIGPSGKMIPPTPHHIVAGPGMCLWAFGLDTTRLVSCHHAHGQEWLDTPRLGSEERAYVARLYPLPTLQ